MNFLFVHLEQVLDRFSILWPNGNHCAVISYRSKSIRSMRGPPPQSSISIICHDLHQAGLMRQSCQSGMNLGQRVEVRDGGRGIEASHRFLPFALLTTGRDCSQFPVQSGISKIF